MALKIVSGVPLRLVVMRVSLVSLKCDYLQQRDKARLGTGVVTRIPQRLDQEDGLSASRESDSFAFPFFREVWIA